MTLQESSVLFLSAHISGCFGYEVYISENVLPLWHVEVRGTDSLQLLLYGLLKKETVTGLCGYKSVQPRNVTNNYCTFCKCLSISVTTWGDILAVYLSELTQCTTSLRNQNLRKGNSTSLPAEVVCVNIPRTSSCDLESFQSWSHTVIWCSVV